VADNSGNGAFVFGFIVGAIAGAAAALFMTPRSGDEMRQEIGGRVYGATGPVLDQVGSRVREMSGKLAAMDIPVGGAR
jgi:gas vesicle protein